MQADHALIVFRVNGPLTLNSFLGLEDSNGVAQTSHAAFTE